MKTETTRRAVMAGLAAAPVAGLPAIAGAMPLSEPLAKAIERHKAAWAARCENRDDSDEVLNRLCDIERDALATLWRCPSPTTPNCSPSFATCWPTSEN